MSRDKMEDDLLISPVMSLVLVVVLMLLMQWGSSFFGRMQQVPQHSWELLNVVPGDLFDSEARGTLLGEASLAGLRSLVSMSGDASSVTQCRAASSLVTLQQVARCRRATPLRGSTIVSTVCACGFTAGARPCLEQNSGVQLRLLDPHSRGQQWEDS